MQPQPLRQQPLPPFTVGVAARLIGWLLLVPAVILTVLTLVVPTVRTVRASLLSESFVGEAESAYVGLDNYDIVFDDPLWSVLWSSGSS